VPLIGLGLGFAGSAGELTPDNLFHAVVGAAFLVAGLTSPRVMPAGRPA